MFLEFWIVIEIGIILYLQHDAEESILVLD